MNCDFCEAENLFELGDYSSVQFAIQKVLKNWCGLCRAGSKIYFGARSNEELIFAITLANEILKRVPLDEVENDLEYSNNWHLFDEMERAKSELVFRVSDEL